MKHKIKCQFAVSPFFWHSGQIEIMRLKAVAPTLIHSFLQQTVLNIFVCALYLEYIVGNKTKFRALLESLYVNKGEDEMI